MHKRTTPKIFARAKELRHNPTPAERKLWRGGSVVDPQGAALVVSRGGPQGLVW